MLNQQKIIHGVVNTVSYRQKQLLLNTKYSSVGRSRTLSNSLFPYQAVAGSIKDDTAISLPKDTRVVICGGGVMGAAVAYHLAELGWGSQTVVLDKGR